MANVQFSIIIPGYNSAGYIDATLESLFRQELQSFEVLIVDDHSTDNTVQVASDALKKYNLAGKVIIRPDTVPKGVANCRNLGIENAAADWVCFLDSDDLFFPGKLSGTAALIEKFGTSCSAYFHAARQFEDGTNKTISIPDIKSYAAPEDISERLVHKNLVTTSSVTLKKSVAEEIGGFDSSLHGVEDYMLWLRVAKRTMWYYSSDVWTDYRVRTSSLMGGREMAYYVEQSIALIKAAKATMEFTGAEIAEIEHYMFADTMHYYAIVSLNTRGWGDFLKGLKALSSAGEIKLAVQLFNKHLRFLALRKLASIKKKKA